MHVAIARQSSTGPDSPRKHPLCDRNKPSGSTPAACPPAPHFFLLRCDCRAVALTSAPVARIGAAHLRKAVRPLQQCSPWGSVGTPTAHAKQPRLHQPASQPASQPALCCAPPFSCSGSAQLSPAAIAKFPPCYWSTRAMLPAGMRKITGLVGLSFVHRGWIAQCRSVQRSLVGADFGSLALLSLLLVHPQCVQCMFVS